MSAAVNLSSGEVCWTIQREIDHATDETRPGLLVAYEALLDLTSRRAPRDSVSEEPDNTPSCCFRGNPNTCPEHPAQRSSEAKAPVRPIKLGDILLKPPDCEAWNAIGGKFGERTFTVLELPKWTGAEWGCHNIRCCYLQHADTGRTVADAYMPGPVEQRPKEPVPKCRECGDTGIVEEDGAGALGYVVKRDCPYCEVAAEKLKAQRTNEAKPDATCSTCGKSYVWWAGKACTCGTAQRTDSALTKEELQRILDWQEDVSSVTIKRMAFELLQRTEPARPEHVGPDWKPGMCMSCETRPASAWCSGCVVEDHEAAQIVKRHEAATSALWRPEWTTVWIVVHPQEGSVPCTDKDLAEAELDILERSSGQKGLIVGPFVMQGSETALNPDKFADFCGENVHRELAALRKVAEAARRWFDDTIDLRKDLSDSGATVSDNVKTLLDALMALPTGSAQQGDQ
jgi:hypothetical protein